MIDNFSNNEDVAFKGNYRESDRLVFLQAAEETGAPIVFGPRKGGRLAFGLYSSSKDLSNFWQVVRRIWAASNN